MMESNTSMPIISPASSSRLLTSISSGEYWLSYQ